MDIEIQVQNIALKSWRLDLIDDHNLKLSYPHLLVKGQTEIDAKLVQQVHNTLKIIFCSDKQVYFNYKSKVNNNNNNNNNNENNDHLHSLKLWQDESGLYFSRWTWLFSFKKFYFMTENLHARGCLAEQKLLFSHFTKMAQQFCIRGEILSPNPDPALEAFLEENKVLRKASVLKHEQYGGRTLIATEAIEPFETVFSIPGHLLLNKINALKDPSAVGDALRTLDQESVDQDTLTLIWILYQKNVLKEKSKWFQFFKTIPNPLSVPLLFSIGNLLELDGVPVLDEIISTRESLQEIWSQIIPDISDRFPDLFNETDFSFEEFLWIRAIFDSRAFLIKINGQKIASLVPFADCANHSPTAQITIVRYDNDNHRLNYQSIVPIQKNEHIFLAYGEFSNRELFLFYGYLEDNNELDSFEISPTLPEDEHFQTRSDILDRYNLRIDQHYLRMGPLSETLKAALRITVATLPELEMLQNEKSKQPNRAYQPISDSNEKMIYETLHTMVDEILNNFDTTLEADIEFLKNPQEAVEDPEWEQRRLCIDYRIRMKRILERALQEADAFVKRSPNLKKLKNDKMEIE